MLNRIGPGPARPGPIQMQGRDVTASSWQFRGPGRVTVTWGLGCWAVTGSPASLWKFNAIQFLGKGSTIRKVPSSGFMHRMPPCGLGMLRNVVPGTGCDGHD